MNPIKKAGIKAKRYALDLKMIEKVLDAPSYYPEKQRKSRDERKKDLLKWLKERGEANEHYNVFGLDICGSDPELYLDYSKKYRVDRDRMNKKNMRGSEIGILEDKFLFYKVMKGYGFKVPEVFAYISNGTFYDNKGRLITADELKGRKDFFLKDACGMKGKCIKHVEDAGDLAGLLKTLPKGDYILQERIIPHEEAKKLYEGSINTVRVVTVWPRGEEPFVFARFQRIGSSRTGNVDNWSSGGLAVGIEDDGHLKEYGFFRFDTDGGITDRHPDSGVVFKEYQIPMFREALKLATDAHSYFHNIFSCGWDIAITQEGPVILEGNDSWGDGAVQVCDRPLKKEWDELVKEYDRSR